MLSWFKKRRLEKRMRQAQRAFDRGFGWAMARMLIHGEPAEYIEDVVYPVEDNPFDKGALLAIAVVEKNNLTKS